MMREKIQEEMKKAMKAQDKMSLEALRFLWSVIRNQEIDKKAELDDKEIEAIIKSERKKREEMIGYLKKAQKSEQVAEEEAKLAVLLKYVVEMSREDIGKAVDEVLAEGISDFGQVMGKVMGITKGQADGRVVSEVVKGKLGEKKGE